MSSSLPEQSDSLDDGALTALAQRAVSAYRAPLRGDLRLLCRSENATFLLTAEGRRHALRVHRGNYHQKADIESELAWLDALREAGFQVPEAIADEQGGRVQTLELADGSERHAVLFHWMEGDEPNADQVDAQAFRQLGRITAQLHAHSKGWLKPAAFQRIVWDHQSMVGSLGHWGDWRETPDLSGEGQAVLSQCLERVERDLEAFGKDASRYGLIHADLRLTNLLLHQGETRVIDFDDCGLGWYLHDLAAAVSFEEHHPNAPRWVENWIQGYEQVAHISDEELAMVPTFLIQRRIQMTAWVGSHAQTQMAKSLGPLWVENTVRLGRRYLEGKELPLGL